MYTLIYQSPQSLPSPAGCPGRNRCCCGLFLRSRAEDINFAQLRKGCAIKKQTALPDGKAALYTRLMSTVPCEPGVSLRTRFGPFHRPPYCLRQQGPTPADGPQRNSPPAGRAITSSLRRMRGVPGNSTADTYSHTAHRFPCRWRPAHPQRRTVR